MRVRHELCQAAVQLARAVKYDNAGTVEFLYDLDQHQWYFIEVNPRIQVEHTVTEVITGVDLVRSQILVAQGCAPARPGNQSARHRRKSRAMGCAVQCRVTTEDPENKFTPDYGRILTYRSTGGYGVRLDGGMGYAGAVITPFYDSLLVKITAFGRDFELALQRMDRALREFRIRGVKTNIPFLENVIANPVFRSGQATTTLIDTTPELFQFKPRRDRATKLLAFLGDVIVNGNPQAKGYVLKAAAAAGRPAAPRPQGTAAAGTRQLLLEMGPKKFAEWTLRQKQLLDHGHDFPRRAPIAAGHARALLRHAGGRAAPWRGARRNCSVWKCGAARPSTPPCGFCTRTRGTACASCAKKFPTFVFRCSFAAPTPSAIPIIRTTSSRVSSNTRRRRASIFSAFSIRSITLPI